MGPVTAALAAVLKEASFLVPRDVSASFAETGSTVRLNSAGKRGAHRT